MVNERHLDDGMPEGYLQLPLWIIDPLATAVANRGPGAITPEADIKTTHPRNIRGSVGPSISAPMRRAVFIN